MTSVALGLVTLVLHAALMLAAAPLLAGIVAKLRARMTGRVGAPVMQPWRDLIRLAGKQRVIAENASPVFLAAPFVVFAATAAAALLVPSFALGMASAPLSDLLVIAGLLGASRAVMALAALDVGTALGGAGAGRSLQIAVLIEPALLLVMVAVAVLAGTSNLDAAGGVALAGSPGSVASLGLALIAVVMIALADCGRRPFGDMRAPHELASAYDLMALEYTGRDLSLIEAAGHLRLLLWCDLICVLFIPFGIAPEDAGLLAWATGLVCWSAKLVLIGLILAVTATATATLRVERVLKVLGVAVLLGLLAVSLLFASQGFA